jgi:hypothetical protein
LIVQKLYWCASSASCSNYKLEDNSDHVDKASGSSLVLLYRASIRSKVSATSFIDGRKQGVDWRHLAASRAICKTCFTGYFPSNLVSIKFLTFLLSDRNGLPQSTKFIWLLGRLLSHARKPVSISNKTTPKLYTSLFRYKFPDHSNRINVRVDSDSMFSINHYYEMGF